MEVLILELVDKIASPAAIMHKWSRCEEVGIGVICIGNCDDNRQQMDTWAATPVVRSNSTCYLSVCLRIHTFHAFRVFILALALVAACITFTLDQLLYWLFSFLPVST